MVHQRAGRGRYDPGSHPPLAIGKHQQGQAVPGLLNTGIEFVHRRHLRTAVQIRLVAECLGHQRDQAVGDRAAAAHRQLKRGVEVGRIAERWVHHRIEVDCRLVHLRQVGLGRLGPVEVAQQGVDLTVVPQQPHRLGQGQRGKVLVLKRR